jgi:tetratricopeptide (TPR) repeat protein
MQSAKGGSAVPENPDRDWECTNPSVAISELAAAHARLQRAEETIAALNQIAEAAQSTIDKLRAELADAEARVTLVARQRDAVAAELFNSVRQSNSVKSKLRGQLGWGPISRFPPLAGLRLRLSLGRARPSLITLADRARDAGDWELAVRRYREALDRNPRNSPIWVQYGHALKETGHVAEAERAYRKTIDLDLDAADSHLQLGHALKLQRRRNEAAAAYLQALDRDPALHAASLELAALGWRRDRVSNRNRSNR